MKMKEIPLQRVGKRKRQEKEKISKRICMQGKIKKNERNWTGNILAFYFGKARKKEGQNTIAWEEKGSKEQARKVRSSRRIHVEAKRIFEQHQERAKNN